MVNRALFSIIMPAYNRAHLIEEALDSVKQQTYRPIELLVINDGSTDSTREVVEAWAQRNEESDALIVKHFFQDNAGASAARNTGIEKASGQYIQFFDSDDRLHPERLRRLASTFETERCDFLQTGFEGFDAESGETIQTLYGKPNRDQLELALAGSLWANTLRSAFTAELVRRMGPWNTEMTCFEDREYVERAISQSAHAVAIEDVLASARRGGSARISDKLRSYEGRTWRIYCESRLAEAVKDREDVSQVAKQAFASRVYALGFRSNASGWPDLGRKCGEIAAQMNVDLDTLGRRRRFFWRLGRSGGQLYNVAGSLKRMLTGWSR